MVTTNVIVTLQHAVLACEGVGCVGPLQFQMRNFDTVFVFKDYKKKISMVTAIPMSQLDSIKHWLE